MKTFLKNTRTTQALVLIACSGLTGSAFAAEYWLRADATTVGMPSGSATPLATDVPVTMWGFAPATVAGPGTAPVTVPGPRLVVPAGDTTLTIHLYNNLPSPVSIVVPGQTATMVPVKFADPQGRQRVRSFTHETPSGTLTTPVNYTWTNLRPGTYLYQSGTHPAVQVQMGLYGSMTSNAVDGLVAGSGQAYPGVAYDNETVLLYSEIDPALHAAVAGGTYGSVAYPSTVNYAPKYFLVNGAPYNSGAAALAAGNIGQQTLLRILNAGLQTHVPLLQGMNMRLVAEDGRAYAYPKEQYSVLLPAGKTVDAVIVPTGTAAATYAVYDRRLSLTNGAAPGGGMFTLLAVGGPVAGVPIATNDSYAVNEDTALTVVAPGVLGNDTGAGVLSAVLVNNVLHGTLQLMADGSFIYMPALNFFGADSFTYKTSNGTLSSNVATVNIVVAPINDAPIAVNDAYGIVTGGTLTVAAKGVLANDIDPDGDVITAALVAAPTKGTLTLSANGSFVYVSTAGSIGTDTFTYQASDGLLLSNIATVTVNILANKAPVAVNDAATVKRSTLAIPTSVIINVLANDYDTDGTLNPATVVIVNTPSRGGIAVANLNGTITFTPKVNFLGTDVFTYTVLDNLGAVSNRATVRVNVTR